jgi:tetratricopeptide (TPR) repeat protein
MRVFLCHSSRDKGVVEDVANKLGRAFVVYDSFSFETGEQFDLAIQRGLHDANLLVLFASQNSLPSHWVRLELSEAQKLTIRGHIRKIIVIIIDEVTKPNDLPAWLQQARAIQLSSSSQIEREIRYQLHSIVHESQAGLFVGRRKEIELAERLIAPTHSLVEPHVFCFYGLSGIGRKTLCARISSGLLSFPKLAVFRIEDGDLVQELALKLYEELTPSPSIAEVENRIHSIEQLSPEALLRTIDDLVSQYVEARELLVLQDEGGLLDNDGVFHREFIQLINYVQDAPKLRMGLVTRRKPSFEDETNALPAIRVSQLETDDIKRLLLRRLRDLQVLITDEEADELAAFVGGYPPAVIYIAEFAKRNGLGKILADKAALVDFTASFMLRMLSKYEPLSDDQKNILVVLSYYSPLPLTVIGQSVGLDADKLDQEIQYLLDVAFIIPDERLFRIADPLINAVIRSFGRAWHQHDKVAESLEEYLKSADDDTRFILARSLFRSLKYSGVTKDSKQSLALTSDLIDLSQHFYHERDYDKSIEFCRAALERRPSNVDVRSYLVRSLIQKEEFDDAEKEISILVSQGQLRDAWFLRGFLHRHRQEYEEAISSYQRSIEYGRRGAAIHRELAQCFYEVGQLDKAKISHCGIAAKRSRQSLRSGFRNSNCDASS